MRIETETEIFVIGEDTHSTKKVVVIHEGGFNLALEMLKNFGYITNVNIDLAIIKTVRTIYSLGLYESKKCLDAAKTQPH